MLSLNSCLSFEEAESILKIGSINIDHIQANQFAYGKYGSGSLNAYNSVKLTNDLITPDNIAYISNQDFYRWDFVINGVSQDIVIQNQKFRDKATLNVVSKNQITIKDETLFAPDSNGYTLLKIDENLVLSTNCEMFSSRQTYNNKKELDTLRHEIILYPNPVSNKLTIISKSELKEVTIYDIMGKIVYSLSNISDNSIVISLENYKSGLFIVKSVLKSGNIVTNKLIKN